MKRKREEQEEQEEQQIQGNEIQEKIISIDEKMVPLKLEELCDDVLLMIIQYVSELDPRFPVLVHVPDDISFSDSYMRRDLYALYRTHSRFFHLIRKRKKWMEWLFPERVIFYIPHWFDEYMDLDITIKNGRIQQIKYHFFSEGKEDIHMTISDYMYKMMKFMDVDKWRCKEIDSICVWRLLRDYLLECYVKSRDPKYKECVGLQVYKSVSHECNKKVKQYQSLREKTLTQNQMIDTKENATKRIKIH